MGLESQPPASGFVVVKLCNGSYHSVNIVEGEQSSVEVISNDGGRSSKIGCDDGALKHHGGDDDVGKAFVPTRWDDNHSGVQIGLSKRFTSQEAKPFDIFRGTFRKIWKVIVRTCYSEWNVRKVFCGFEKIENAFFGRNTSDKRYSSSMRPKLWRGGDFGGDTWKDGESTFRNTLLNEFLALELRLDNEGIDMVQNPSRHASSHVADGISKAFHAGFKTILFKAVPFMATEASFTDISSGIIA